MGVVAWIGDNFDLGVSRAQCLRLIKERELIVCLIGRWIFFAEVSYMNNYQTVMPI